MITAMKNKESGWPERFHVISLSDIGAFLGHIARLGIKATPLHCPDHYEPVRGAEPMLDMLLADEHSDLYELWKNKYPDWPTEERGTGW